MAKRLSSTTPRPFDAVLIVSFGGPHGINDVRPFLGNVLRGRQVRPERIEEVARHYERFGGVSPITELTRRQADGLRRRLHQNGIDLPVYVGMRHWHPLLADTLGEMAQAGVRQAIGFIAAAHHCYASCGQYKQAVCEARHELVQRGLPDVQITYVDSWYDHQGFIAALAYRARQAFDQLGPSLGREARIVFTAHSIPLPMARACRYVEQLTTTAQMAARSLNRSDWTLVYQSRSGPPQEPWLEPDICHYLRAEHARGLPAAVISPIGFVCDHIEVLYDLDIEAAQVCRELNLPMVRAQTVNDDPIFVHMMADVVQQTYQRYRNFPPLPIVAAGPEKADARSTLRRKPC